MLGERREDAAGAAARFGEVSEAEGSLAEQREQVRVD
jgi:hypothetical protein